MELSKQTDTLCISGVSMLRAWEANALPTLMRPGLNLREAQQLAEASGCLRFATTVPNLVTTLGKQLVGDLMIDLVTTGITFHAIGTGATAPALGDTKLTSEVARKQISLRTRAGNTLTFSTFYLAAECQFNLREAGTFGGATANMSIESGKLFSHYLQSYDNSAGLVDLTFDYSVTIG